MHPFFSVSLYTGQQLVLAGLQRWVFDPYKRLEHRRQRASLRALVILLVKTAATGVLAALLDAAIEYRTRQLVALAQEEDQTDGNAPSLSSPSRLAALGMLSRGGVAVWKSRLLQAIDEMEQRAQRYGLSSSRAGRLEGGALAKGDGKEEEATAASDEGLLPSHTPSDSDTRGFLVRQTIQQLQELMRRDGSDEESHEQVEQRVDRLLDHLLGPHEGQGQGTCPKTCSEPLSDSGPMSSPEGCPICMDASMRVSVSGCGHGLCFDCARQLCNAREHTLPACPFCRRPIEGFELCST